MASRIKRHHFHPFRDRNRDQTNSCDEIGEHDQENDRQTGLFTKEQDNLNIYNQSKAIEPMASVSRFMGGLPRRAKQESDSSKTYMNECHRPQKEQERTLKSGPMQ